MAIIDRALEKVDLRGLKKSEAELTIAKEIRAWENNADGENPKGYKIVRGLDGEYVEVVCVRGGGNPVYGIIVNGLICEHFERYGNLRTLNIALVNLKLKQFLLHDAFAGWYDLKGIKAFSNVRVSEVHHGFVFGLPGEQPRSIQVNQRMA